jgi:hypothetical protein
MFFLVRVAFWLTIVLVLLPSGGAQPNSQAAKIDAGDAVVAAGAAVSDMSGFCDRQAEACVVGSQAAAMIGQRAQAGARMVYDFINERVARSETGSLSETSENAKPADARIQPASLTTNGASHNAAHGAPPSQSTLKPSDRAPSWHGPAQHKQPRRDGRRPA